MTEENSEITYEGWYPDVPPVMDSQQLAELLSTSDQVIRIWAREGVIPSHRQPSGRKFKFLRHEIFEWLIENRYDPNKDDST
ncbi:MAG: helix-turn-helix domain-containing protein [bacterium]